MIAVGGNCVCACVCVWILHSVGSVASGGEVSCDCGKRIVDVCTFGCGPFALWIWWMAWWQLVADAEVGEICWMVVIKGAGVGKGSGSARGRWEGGRWMGDGGWRGQKDGIQRACFVVITVVGSIIST